KCDAARRMALRIKEHLDVADVVGPCPFEVGPREVVKILLGDQDRHALVVEVEKILQVAEAVRAAQLVDRRIFQPNAVPSRQRDHQLRLEAALDMDVQLAFRQPLDQRVDGLHVGSPARRSGECAAVAARRLEGHCPSMMAAIAWMRLRAYFGSPALIELPELNELLPIRSCAGTRLRSTGALAKSRCLLSTSSRAPSTR